MADLRRLQREFASFIEKDGTQPQYPNPHLMGRALPEKSEMEVCPFPLLLWWALLLGLSSLARYHPAAWTAAIDLDASDLAVSLERVLDVAKERVPARILQSLT
jgi:YaaC-like protein